MLEVSWMCQAVGVCVCIHVYVDAFSFLLVPAGRVVALDASAQVPERVSTCHLWLAVSPSARLTYLHDL